MRIETVRFENWEPNTTVELDSSGGAEVFVLEGGFQQEEDTLRQYSWLRMPVGSKTSMRAGPDGAGVWIKTGHLTGL